MSKFVFMARCVALLFVVLLAPAPNFGLAPDPPKTAPYKITAITAKLFYDGKGTFSRDVLAKPDFLLGNTIIGGGEAEGPSNSTLVLSK